MRKEVRKHLIDLIYQLEELIDSILKNGIDPDFRSDFEKIVRQMRSVIRNV